MAVSNQWCAQKLASSLKSSLSLSGEDLPSDTSSLQSWLDWPAGKGGKYMTLVTGPPLLYKGDVIIRDVSQDYVAIVYEGGSVSSKYKIIELDSATKKSTKKESTGHVAYVLRFRGGFSNPSIAGASAADGKKVSRASRFRAQGVDARIIDIIERAGMAMPAEYKTVLISGLRPGDKRWHGKGKAVDIQLSYNGKILGNYQNAADFRHYEIFAQKARQIQMAAYPELNSAFRFGGYFSGPRGKYGALDSMHFDIGGGPTGGGSWAGGLTAAQKNYFPGVVSVGMGS